MIIPVLSIATSTNSCFLKAIPPSTGWEYLGLSIVCSPGQAILHKTEEVHIVSVISVICVQAHIVKRCLTVNWFSTGLSTTSRQCRQINFKVSEIINLFTAKSKLDEPNNNTFTSKRTTLPIYRVLKADPLSMKEWTSQKEMKLILMTFTKPHLQTEESIIFNEYR